MLNHNSANLGVNMKNFFNRCTKAGFGLIVATAATAAFAQDDVSASFDGPLYAGSYIAPMASGMFPGSKEGLKDAVGGALRSEEHTSELQSLMRISYAVFCL